ncbi:MAG TPA: hypothetical protein VK826_12060 [Bacteroidia bacterium]|nr:hypothetical protein [Bacteroidia bacterium]
MKKYIPLFGWAGLIFGITTAISSFLPGYGFFIAMTSALPGFLTSSLYVLLSSRYEVKAPRINPGYIGMALSSTPIIIFIIFAIS